MKEKQELRNILDRIDRKGYPAYKELKGVYKFDEYIFVIEHVQGDPFAAPSSVKIEVADKIAGFPRDLYEMKCKKIALQDYLLREFGIFRKLYAMAMNTPRISKQISTKQLKRLPRILITLRATRQLPLS